MTTTNAYDALSSSLKGRKVLLHDMCLRDGMHAKREQISVAQMVQVATALDAAGVPMIQVSHGAGLGGNSLQHGFALAKNEEYLQAVTAVVKQTKVSVLLIPGLGTMRELQSAYDCGARSVHVATHCTEADTSPQHIAYARKLGMDTTGFLMMAHLNSPEGLAQQGKLMEGYGAQTIYITDSAGYMLPEHVTAAVSRLREVLKPETEIGFHGHHNLGLGISNSIAAIAAGASRIDGSVGGLGAGAGNTPLEVLLAVCERMGIDTGVDLFKLMDVAEDVILPLMAERIVRIDRDSLT
ncbi:MAG TPA: 4-hydroxy-2-oxovalerate aldolase, partial [Burkholderiaceae bacterium]|nr:4-hydroxy-2-oxovalerate aldolase [Burkholderiaceae bacterium]